MSLQKFTILNQNDSHQREEKINILINLDHIVSLKPIRMPTKDGQVIEGYWLRLSNGKKYKALQVPMQLQTKLEEELPAPSFLPENAFEEQIQ